MGSGFQSWAQDGSNVVQIDGDAGVPNLQLVSKVTVAVTTSVASGTLGAHFLSAVQTLPAGIVNPVIAVQCTSTIAGVYWISATQYQLVAATSTSVTIYIFGKASASGSTSGFQVFDASGNLVYDGGRAPMRVVANYITTALGNVGTLPTGKTYAAVVSAGSARFVQGAGPGMTLAYVLKMVATFNSGSGAVDMYGVAVEYTAPDASAKTSWPYGTCYVLMLDVTNL